jgi:peptide/nickel transport system ATP-binding protein
MSSLLSIRNLCVDYITGEGPVRAVDDLSIDVESGEILGIAGESGSGKTTLAKALLRILPPPAVISRGEVVFEGKDVLSLSERELREIRWNRLSMVFQSAMNALNPVTPIREQITDAILAHSRTDSREAMERAGQLLEMVDIPRGRLDSYSHQLSGGMRQRVGIAIALALEPSLVILDEPTTALDVIVEREILETIKRLQREHGFAVVFITHDLGRMLQFSDRVAVLYAARLVESGPAAALRQSPRHPYTQGLIRAMPDLHPGDEEAVSIPGSPPSLLNPPSGCRFHPRCDQVIPICSEVSPELREAGKEHCAACHLVE